MGPNSSAYADSEYLDQLKQRLYRTAAMLFVRISSQNLQNTVRAAVTNGHPQSVSAKDLSRCDSQLPSFSITSCFMLTQSSMADS